MRTPRSGARLHSAGGERMNGYNPMPKWRVLCRRIHELLAHGRREFVLMSAEQYDWLRASAQRSHRTDDAADVAIDAVERAEMDVEHKPLDDLLT